MLFVSLFFYHGSSWFVSIPSMIKETKYNTCNERKGMSIGVIDQNINKGYINKRKST